MFSSYVLYDTVAIEAVYFPHNFTAANVNAHNYSNSRDTKSNGNDDDKASYELTIRDILLHRLTERYVGRVIPSRGLCVAITEVMEYSASSVRGAAASAWLTATFGVCVFAPTPGTRLKARIAHQNAFGIYLTLDLFVSIPFLVPAAMLVPGSRYHAAQRSWYLPLDGSGDDVGGTGAAAAAAAEGGEKDVVMPHASETASSSSLAAPTVPHNKYIVGAEVIVKVVSCTVLSEEAAVAAGEAESSNNRSAGAGAEFGGNNGSEGPPSLMELRGTFIGDALGPVSWFEDA